MINIAAISKRKKFSLVLSKKGYTLIEIITAVAIFSITMIAVINIFINSIKQQKTVIMKQFLIDNARYIMDFMVKDLRMAKSISTKNARSDTLQFKNYEGNDVSYSLSNYKIMRQVGSGQNYPISSDEIKIAANNLVFSVNNWDLDNGPVPLVSIYFEIEDPASSTQHIRMQSTITPRIEP